METSDKKSLQPALGELSVNYREILRAPSLCWKVFWVTVFLGVLGIFGIQLQYQVDDYLDYPVNSRVFQDYGGGSLELPRLTLCTNDFLQRDALAAAFPDPKDLRNFLVFFDEGCLFRLDTDKNAYASSFRALLRNLTIPCSRMMDGSLDFGCTKYDAANSSASAGFACCNDSAAFFHAGMMCHTIQARPQHRRQGVVGSADALSVQFMMRIRNSTEMCMDSVVWNPVTKKNESRHHPFHPTWTLHLSDWADDASVSEYNSLILMHGRVNELKIRKKVTRSQAPPYGSCGTVPLKHFRTYTQDHCLIEQLHDSMVAGHGCAPFDLLEHRQVDSKVHPFAPHSHMEGKTAPQVPHCFSALTQSRGTFVKPMRKGVLPPFVQYLYDSYDDDNGEYGAEEVEEFELDNETEDALNQAIHFKERKLGSASEEDTIRLAECPRACRETEYEMRLVDYGEVPSFFPVNVVQKTQVDVYYSSIGQTVFEERPRYHVLDLLVKISALLNFWLGIKLMTFLQLAYFSHWAFRRRYGPQRPQPKPSTSSQAHLARRERKMSSSMMHQLGATPPISPVGGDSTLAPPAAHTQTFRSYMPPGHMP